MKVAIIIISNELKRIQSITTTINLYTSFYLSLDIVGVNKECPNEEDLPVLNERGDKFYCAFSWDERGGDIAREGCKGTKTVFMDGDNFSVNKNINKGMLSTGSIMVEVGCTLTGYQVCKQFIHFIFRDLNFQKPKNLQIN